jgi:hypothetical protein
MQRTMRLLRGGRLGKTGEEEAVIGAKEDNPLAVMQHRRIED